MTTVIEADHYRTTRDGLTTDPIIRQLATELSGTTEGDALIAGTFVPGLMQAALNEYRRRGGTRATHIGGPVEAVALILKGGAQ